MRSILQTVSQATVRVGLALGVLMASVGLVVAAPTAAYASGGSPASLVNVFAGTGTSKAAVGVISEFPSASLPFGMIQWGPDTSPHRQPGSGYAYQDSHISGFSLTHLSGDGCAAYGDVPILPTIGALRGDPARMTEPFSHKDESAAPGHYDVTLGHSGIDAQLAVTTRTGIGSFTFPPSHEAHLLFKLSQSASGTLAAAAHRVGDDQMVGHVQSGQFCGTGTNYTIYFDAVFNRPFTGAGSWKGSAIDSTGGSCLGATCGTYVTFDTESNRTVEMKVGISFVSVANAAANIRAEDSGWSLSSVATAATQKWNAILDRISVSGGTSVEHKTFDTALYHALLSPNIVSDDNGQYAGADGHVHTTSRGQYANFSEWDIYRCEVPLLSLIAPKPTSDMMQSLVNDAQQEGVLPKWAIVAGDAAQMNGDSADPILADAYAFGVHDFNTAAALDYMVKGADIPQPAHGLDIERQYLSQYLGQHYVNAGVFDLDSINYSAGASMTLEYAIDDSTIAEMAKGLGNESLAQSMSTRAQDWEYLFNAATGYLAGRDNNASFPPGPAFNKALFEPGGTQGFEEGNAIQYTWSVPQNLAGLAALMGGDAKAVAKLNTYFTKLDAGRFAPYDWAGNEPNLWSPWEYDFFSAPWRTQSVVRRIMTTQYSDGVVDEPGNDDLGAISSWYVWSALGLYPVTPGSANLALAAPLFPLTNITLPDGHHLILRAPAASAGHPYIHSLHLSDATIRQPRTSCGSDIGATAASSQWSDPWIPADLLTSGGTLTYSLSGSPDRQWGTLDDEQPPSMTTAQLPGVGFTEPSGTLDVKVGSASAFTFGLQDISSSSPAVVWKMTPSPGLTLSKSFGIFAKPTSGTTECAPPAPATQSLMLTATTAGSGTVTVTMLTPSGINLPPVVLNVVASP